MHPDLYCADKAAPPGSPAHYCLLGSDAGTRATLGALWALERELAGIVPECREPAVARAKFDWWRTELRTLEGGTPQHPVTQALAPRLRARGLDAARLLECLEGHALVLDYDAWPNHAVLVQHALTPTGATPARLAVELLGAAELPGAAAGAHELGLAHAQFERLREVRADALRGHCTVPDDELAAHGLTHADLLKPQTSAATQALFAAQIARIRATQARGLERLSPAARRALTPLVVRAALEAATLTEIEADGLALLERRVELTPLRLLWQAWRARRRARRGG